MSSYTTLHIFEGRTDSEVDVDTVIDKDWDIVLKALC